MWKNEFLQTSSIKCSAPKKTHLKTQTQLQEKTIHNCKERCHHWNCPAKMSLQLIKKPLFPYSRTVIKPLHTPDKPPPDHYRPIGTERGQTETGTWKSLPLIINWSWGSWCQCSSLGRWQEERWDRCQIQARGQGLKPESQLLDCWYFWQDQITKVERNVGCLAGHLTGRA